MILTTNNNSIDKAVSLFIATYLNNRPRSKFSYLTFTQQKIIASKYCRFVFCCGQLKSQGKLTETEIRVLNTKAEKALNQCNVNDVNKLANKVVSLLK